MIILTIKTDVPEAEIGIFDDTAKIDYLSYAAHRTLAETLHGKIEQLLSKKGLDWQGIEGIVCFEGPGSFTGLRIGLTLANTLAYSLRVPIVGSRSANWLTIGLDKLLAGQDQKTILPHYGSPPHITKQKK